MSIYKLLIIIICTQTSLSSHFRGGTIMWKLVSSDNLKAIINVTLKFGWRRDASQSFFCNQTYIQSRTRMIGELGLNVTPGILSTNFSGVYCTDFSEADNWSYGEITLPVRYNAIYTGTTYQIVYSGDAWIPLLNGGRTWNLISRVNLNIQNRTQRINQSPITSMSPLIKIPTGCYQEIRIPIDDADGDLVRCRWSIGTECGDSCTIPQGVELDSIKCLLKFNLPTSIGYYGLRIQIEDFQNGNLSAPMSSIPLEFLVQSFTPENCTFNKPQFLPPTAQDETCIPIPLGSTYNETIIVTTNYTSVITEIQTVSPPGLLKSPLYSFGNVTKYVNLTWTPTTSGVKILCFVGITESLVSTEQRCISLAVGYEPPIPIVFQKSTAKPIGFIYSNNTEWSITLNQNVMRPSIDSFIRFNEKDTGKLVYQVNAKYEDEVSIKNDTIKISIKNKFLNNNKTYYITFDSDVVETNYGCKLRSDGINSFDFWSFTVKDCDNCGDHGTCVDVNQCKCDTNWQGLSCNLPICYNNCSNHGQCVDINTCQCYSGYTGEVCGQFLCKNVNNCSTHGTCIAIDKCQCEPNWSGQNCNVPFCFNNCTNNGDCVGPNTCKCIPGYTGTLCNQLICYSVKNCSNHGTCIGVNLCQCDVNWSGQSCDVPQCVKNCNDNGRCVDVDVCECYSSYTGTFCDQVTCYSRKNCSNHGTCIGVNQCSCYPNWSGSSCDTPSCMYNCSGNGKCVDFNTCQCFTGYSGKFCDQYLCSNSCSNHGSCIGSNQCQCNVNWSGQSCDVPQCGNNCNNHGRCVDVNLCECYAGFTGTLCGQSLCSSLNNCSNHGTCIGVNQCKCDTNWQGSSCDTPFCTLNCSGNGKCVDVNVCQCDQFWSGLDCEVPVCTDKCNNNGKCTDGNVCQCFLGYTGTFCKHVECGLLNNCSNHGSCNLDQCVCDDGWSSEDCSKKKNGCENCYEFNCLAIILTIIIGLILTSLFFSFLSYYFGNQIGCFSCTMNKIWNTEPRNALSIDFNSREFDIIE
jgi:hypothetical protein